MSEDSVSYRSVGDQVPMRSRLLKAAAELFSSRGYYGSSLMDIALYCGVRKSTVFHYFPSKQALALETIQVLQTYCETSLLSCLQKKCVKSPEQKAIDFIEFIQEFFQHRKDSFLVNFIALELLDEADSPFNEPVQRYFATWKNVLLEILAPLHGKAAQDLASRSLLYLQGVQIMMKINQTPCAVRQIPHYLLEIWKVKP